MPCNSAGHPVHYTACGHCPVNPSSQPSFCDDENCKDNFPRTCSLPEGCPKCSAESDSVLSWDPLPGLELNIAKPKRLGPDPEASSRLVTEKKADITTSVDDNQKSTSKTPSEAETKPSFPANCECSNTTIQYEGCIHTIQTTHRTEGCPKECAYEYGSKHVVPGACPDCSAHSRLKGNDKGNFILKGCMSADRLMRLETEKNHKKAEGSIIDNQLNP
jgi:hypothetical protein